MGLLFLEEERIALALLARADLLESDVETQVLPRRRRRDHKHHKKSLQKQDQGKKISAGRFLWCALSLSYMSATLFISICQFMLNYVFPPIPQKKTEVPVRDATWKRLFFKTPSFSHRGGPESSDPGSCLREDILGQSPVVFEIVRRDLGALNPIGLPCLERSGVLPFKCVLIFFWKQEGRIRQLLF